MKITYCDICTAKISGDNQSSDSIYWLTTFLIAKNIKDYCYNCYDDLAKEINEVLIRKKNRE